jgi:hypothetical protein
MSWTESLLCWFKPSHWRDQRRLAVAEPSNTSRADGAADTAEPDLHDAHEFTDHDVSDRGVT